MKKRKTSVGVSLLKQKKATKKSNYPMAGVTIDIDAEVSSDTSRGSSTKNSEET